MLNQTDVYRSAEAHYYRMLQKISYVLFTQEEGGEIAQKSWLFSDSRRKRPLFALLKIYLSSFHKEGEEEEGRSPNFFKRQPPPVCSPWSLSIFIAARSAQFFPKWIPATAESCRYCRSDDRPSLSWARRCCSQCACLHLQRTMEHVLASESTREDATLYLLAQKTLYLELLFCPLLASAFSESSLPLSLLSQRLSA